MLPTVNDLVTVGLVLPVTFLFRALTTTEPVSISGITLWLEEDEGSNSKSPPTLSSYILLFESLKLPGKVLVL